jgi:hypothetical protein
MTTSPVQTARWFPAASTGHHVAFLQSCPVELRALLIAAALTLCFSYGTFIEQQHQRLGERAMMSAMLASGGMPLIYSPPALCSVPRAVSGFRRHEMETLVEE